MAAFVACLVLLLTMVGHSVGNYCVCNSGLSDAVLQKNIDYACANGADCAAINPNGACYNPNTVKDHCNYAVNSYYQKKSQMGGNCDFQGTATISANPPSAGSGCVYQSSPSSGGTTTPTTSPPTGGTSAPPAGGTTAPPAGGTTAPPAGGTTAPGGAMAPPGGSTAPGGVTTPPSGGGTLTPGGGTTPGGTTPGTMPGSTISPGVGLGPTGSGFDSNASVKPLSQSSRRFMVGVVSLYLCVVISGGF